MKDLLFIDGSFASAASPQECQILLDMAPPMLHQASKGVELLNYGEFPPLQAPPLQGPLQSCELTHYTFTMALLSTRLLCYQRLLILGNGIVLSSFVKQSLPTRTMSWLCVKELSITSWRTSHQWGWRDECNHSTACSMV